MYTDNRFYNKSRAQQNKIQLYIALSATLIAIVFIVIGIYTGLYIIPIVIISITISIIAPFFDTPSLVKNGKLKYLSSFVLAEERKGKKITLHGGTLFDYVFTLEDTSNGNQRTKIILMEFTKGILRLIEEHENKQDDQLIIRGTSYIVNEKTIKKFGFNKVKTSFIQTIILLFNYSNLLLSISFVKRKLTFPRLSNIITFEADLIQLSQKREYIKSLYDKLK
jgi:hypothetical protein